MCENRVGCPQCGCIVFAVLRGDGEYWLICGKCSHRLRQFFVLVQPGIPDPPERSPHAAAPQVAGPDR